MRTVISVNPIHADWACFLVSKARDGGWAVSPPLLQECKSYGSTTWRVNSTTESVSFGVCTMK